ncbi:MAG: acyl-CoA thioesterase [Methylocystaceae bacterium]|nr:acyl-CoA thioesterase [Methylocystaceae bacterium]
MADLQDLTQRETFNFWTEETFRFADLDALNHLNNIASAVYCETARADFFVRVLDHDFRSKINWVIANLNITYRLPVDYPNDISIGTKIGRIGNSSIVIHQGLFAKDVCFSTAETVLVKADLDTGKSVPFDEEMKQKLAAYL